MATVPTIAMIPSGYKANKVYSVLPTNGDADLTFARTSEALRVNSNKLVESVVTGVPRLDYSDSTCASLLVEPQSTNLITYSSDFSDASWTKSNTTISSNSASSPEGDLTADEIIDDATNSFHRIQQTFAVVSGTYYSQSIFVKKGANRYFYLGTNNFSFWDFTFFDLESLVAVSTPAGVTTEMVDLGNGWVRLSASKQANSSGSFTFCFGTSDNTSTSYIGTGVSVVSVWESQLEALRSPTSIITTSGTTATRNAESFSKTGLSDYINSNEGTLKLTINNTYLSSLNKGIELQSAANDDSDVVAFRFDSDQELNFLLVANSVTVIDTSVATAETGYIEVAIQYKSGDNKMFVNGVSVYSDTNTFSFSSALSVLKSVGYFRLSELEYYPDANQNLATLTA